MGKGSKIYYRGIEGVQVYTGLFLDKNLNEIIICTTSTSEFFKARTESIHASLKYLNKHKFFNGSEYSKKIKHTLNESTSKHKNFLNSEAEKVLRHAVINHFQTMPQETESIFTHCDDVGHLQMIDTL